MSRRGAARQIEINALLNRPQGGRIEVPGVVTAVPISATLQEMLLQARAKLAAGGARQGCGAGQRTGGQPGTQGLCAGLHPLGGYFNQGGLPPLWKAQVDFKLPAYFWRKQRAEVTGQEASASQARHEYAATLVEVEAEIREQYSTAEASLKLVNLYEKTVIPEARLAYESALAVTKPGAAISSRRLPVSSAWWTIH